MSRVFEALLVGYDALVRLVTVFDETVFFDRLYLFCSLGNHIGIVNF